MVHIRDIVRLAVGRDGSPGRQPDWMVLDLHGSYPTHASGGALSMLRREESFEQFTGRLERLAQLPWLTGVLVRVGDLKAGLATSRALGTALGRLAKKVRVVGYVPQVSMRSLLVTAELAEIAAPESAEVHLPGFGAEQVYLGAFLHKHGVGFENLRIREYKSALTRFSEDHMDAYEREQLTAYLSSAERAWLQAVADGAEPGSIFDAGLTSAADLLAAGLITTVAYDDDLVRVVDQPIARSLELLLPPRPCPRAGTRPGSSRRSGARSRPRRRAGGVAVVPVIGAIVSGRSRPAPPLPLVSGPLAGANTVVATLRKADRDEQTAAIVLYVDSPGGSALASDLIHRAVARCRKPVVAVMGEVAASGGSYVLAGAGHVVASPFTLTGSIGVVLGKPVLAQFNAKHGLKPETAGRELALFNSPNRSFSEAERQWAEKMMAQAYDRFIARVATGRAMTPEQVDRIGRGRIWSGQDARGHGLVDELGGLHEGIAAARRLAGLGAHAPVRHASLGFSLPGVPAFGHGTAQGASGAVERLWPFGSERVLTWFDQAVRIRWTTRLGGFGPGPGRFATRSESVRGAADRRDFLPKMRTNPLLR